MYQVIKNTIISINVINFLKAKIEVKVGMWEAKELE